MPFRSKLALGAIAALLSVLPLLPPGPASAEPAAGTPGGYKAASPEYGMSVFVYGNTGTTARDLKKLTDLGFGWQKTLFRWRDLETDCKGCYAWDEADRVVKASNDAGVKIIARIDWQPRWARRDGAENGAPDRYEDFNDFIKAFVTRYKQGSTRGTVQAIEIWNEVNLQREWGSPISQQSAADYIRLLSGAYRAAKSADPTVTVITAGLSPTGWNDDTARPDDQFLQWMFDAGLRAGTNYDVLGAHGNTQCPSVEASFGACPVMADRMGHASFYFRRIEQLRDIQVNNGDGDAQIWLLEFGWTTDQVNPQYSWFATDETTKANLIVQAFQYARNNWAPWIGVMTLWTLADPNWPASYEQVYWAVTNPNGTARPAYTRLQQALSSGELPSAGPGTAPIAVAPPPDTTPVSPPASTSTSATTSAPVASVGPSGSRFRILDPELSGVNFRKSPGITGERIRTLTNGELLDALGPTAPVDGHLWRLVRDASGQEGWVVDEVLAPS